jgi:hypothetical protein
MLKLKYSPILMEETRVVLRRGSSVRPVAPFFREASIGKIDIVPVALIKERQRKLNLKKNHKMIS